MWNAVTAASHWKKTSFHSFRCSFGDWKKGDCPVLRPVVQHNDRQVKPEKMPTVPLYFDKLLPENVWIQRSSQRFQFLPRQVFPEGLLPSCRTDMSHTLAQNCHCEFCCGMHRTCKNIPFPSGRHGSVMRPEKMEEATIARYTWQKVRLKINCWQTSEV